ncbi:MAG: hypothetical protein ACRERD_26565, partial [Candidatus Binatia bacterium]
SSSRAGAGIRFSGLFDLRLDPLEDRIERPDECYQAVLDSFPESRSHLHSINRGLGLHLTVSRKQQAA